MILNSKKIIWLLLISIIFITGCGKKETEEIGNIAEQEYTYTDAYYLRTTFTNQTFEVLSDFDMGNGVWYHLATIPQAMTELQRNTAEMYSEEFAPHTIILRYMNADDHNRITQGKDIYVDSFTVTTVIVPTESDEYPFGYVFNIIEETPTAEENIVRKALFDVNGKIGDRDNDLTPMPQETKSGFENYLKQFAKWEDEI